IDALGCGAEDAVQADGIGSVGGHRSEFTWNILSTNGRIDSGHFSKGLFAEFAERLGNGRVGR
ncbi:MAG TPA: hypothetical protein VK968_05725, partial [Roseimicrobium sp.]|nr:hypothetical protein [Roseimicrobium sp.]